MRRVLPWLLLAALLLAAGGSIAWRFLTDERKFEFDTKSVRMEVVNCCGAARVGRAVADELQARGFDVYSVLGSPETRARTTVVDLRDPSGRAAAKVARALSFRRHWWRFPYGHWITPARAVAIDSTRYLEIRLVVGADYRRFFPNVIPLY